ncbi:ATP-binding cassette domain-containing protein [Mahella sp.]|uniref:ATP-binding cassette domain-containing protein n=1 Tax=Mahella sp. TaxID=2798721 RepID=UPI0025C18DBE|nr:ATP-binding cassette domain-containing protein [Mahella sp.]MBZ4666226.1 ABC-type sugar transport system ATPase component-like protein [Mahella sp.]
MKNEILRMEHITVAQNEMVLLNDFNLHIFQSEIIGLVCINTNGQDAILRLLSQNIPIQYGRVYFNEKLVNSYQHGPMTMNKVAIIEQKSRLIENLTVVDNVYVMRFGFKKYLINPRVLEEQLRRFTQDADIDLDGNRLVSSLTAYEKCVTELLRAIVMGAKLIAIREISNVLSTTDLLKFHSLLRYYRDQGFSFVYICSHHEEAFKVCDRVAIMRDGKILRVLDKDQFNNDNVAPYYIGEFAKVKREGLSVTSDKGILTFKDVCTEHMRSLTFTIVKGESTVLLDMDNAVVQDIVGLMNGQLHQHSGEIYLKNKPYTQKLAKHALKYGVAFIQENPILTMLFPDMSYLTNLCFLVDKKRNPVQLSKRVINSIVQEYEPIIGNDIYETDIMKLKLQSLYDLVYYRIHLCKPDIVFCIQPFANADMYLRRHIVELINQLKKQGATIVILATNIADSLAVADKLIVVSKGTFQAEYPRDEFYLFNSESIIL